MLLIQKGKPTKAICRECRKLHAPKDCPRMEWKIIMALGSGIPYGTHYCNIAAKLGIPWRRVQQCVGRLHRDDRSLLG